MHVFNRSFLFGIAVLFVLTACGGSGGGDEGDNGDNGDNGDDIVTLAVGAFVKKFGAIGNGSGETPLASATFDTKSQFLYLADEVGGSGEIDAIRIRTTFDSLAGVTCPNVTITMGHSNVATLVPTFASNIETGQGSVVTVLSDAALSIPAGTVPGDWIEISFTESFDYNGVDNLVVGFESTTRCTGPTVEFELDSGPVGRHAFSNEIDTQAGIPQFNANAAEQVENFLLWMQFVFAGGVNNIEIGTDPNPAPFFQFPFKLQNLYLASEIEGFGPITGIAFQADTTTTEQTYSYTLRLGHSTLSTLTTTYDDNFSDTPVTVANAVTDFVIPAGVPPGEWFWVPIPDGIFEYNGIDNLIIEVNTSDNTGSTDIRTNKSLVDRGLFVVNDSAATVGTLEPDVRNIALRFNGAPVHVLSDSVSSDIYFNDGLARGIGSIYSATELGTGGTITSIACRAAFNTVVGNYPSYNVIIGHSNEFPFNPGSLPETTFVSQNVAFAGTYTIPDTLLRGDWIDIPLSAPFEYDGKSNLIIWQGTTAADGTGNNFCSSGSFSGDFQLTDGLGGGVNFDVFIPLRSNLRLTIER